MHNKGIKSICFMAILLFLTGILLAERSVPILRYRNQSTGEHIFISPQTAGVVSDYSNYFLEKSKYFLRDNPHFYLLSNMDNGTIPVVLMKSILTNKIILSSSVFEQEKLEENGCVNSGIIGFIYSDPWEGASEVYRLKNEISGDYVYTTSIEERSYYLQIAEWRAVESLGYTQSFSSIGIGKLKPNVTKIERSKLNQAILDNCENQIFIPTQYEDESVRVGSILYAEKSPLRPYGYVKKVKFINHISGGIYLNMSDVSLLEAFDELHIFVDKFPLIFSNNNEFDNRGYLTNEYIANCPLYGDSYRNISQSSENHTLELEYIANIYKESSFSVEGSGSLNIADWSFKSEIAPLLTLSGRMKIGANISLIIDFGFGLDKFLFTITPYENMQLNIDAGGKIEAGSEIKIGSLEATFVGPFGIPITPSIDIYAGYDAGVTVHAGLGINQSGSLEVGVDFNRSKRDDWNFWCNPNQKISLNYDKPSVDAHFTVYLRPQATLSLGVPGLRAGVSAGIKTYLEARNESSNIGVYAGISPFVGATLELLWTDFNPRNEFNKIYESRLWGTNNRLSVTSFSINNNLPITTSRIVILNNECSSTATHYMASERPNYDDATWQAYTIVPQFSLSPNSGFKTVYFKVKNNTENSDSVSDSIRLVYSGAVPTLELDPASGKKGEIFAFRGENYTPNGSVEMIRKKVGDSASRSSIYGNSVSGLGKLEIAIRTDCNSEAGTYSVTVVDSTTGIKSNQVIQIIEENPNCSNVSINEIYPGTAQRGQTVIFTLTGAGFKSGFTAKIINELNQEWDISQTEFLSSTQVRVTVAIGAGTDTATQYIRIINPDGANAQIGFTAQGTGTTPLRIDSISPNSVNKGTTVTFTLTGAGFKSGFTAKIINELNQQWDISQTEFLSSTQVRVTVAIGAGTDTATQYIRIINPDSQSAQIAFTAQGTSTPTLRIDSISPNTVTKGTTVTFTLTGAGFQSGFTAKIINELNQEWDIAQREFLSSTQVRVTVFIGAGTTTATQYIKIINPDNQSAQIAFTAQGTPTLTIDGGTSSSKPRGGTYNFSGANYTPNSTVTRRMTQPDGSTITLTPTISTNSSGGISWSYTSVSTTPLGTYTIWVIDDSSGRISNTVNEIVSASILSSTYSSSRWPSKSILSMMK